ncbi:MAG: hypothetical protein QM497_02510 [Sulfurimonas sp.]
MLKTIFLKENEPDIFQSLKAQGIDTKLFESKLANLFNRVYNNYVGYYIFKQNETVYKLIVLPKTIKETSTTKEKEFVNYLLHYHRINTIYQFDKEKKIPDSLLSLAFEDNNKENSHEQLDRFEFYKYKAILDEIEGFFKKHKNYKRVTLDYSSQSIKYKLNLLKNIKEIDKTKIHQTHVKDMMFSTIATIVYKALKIFIVKKIRYIEKKYQDELFRQTNKLNNFILKKYKVDRSYKLSLSKFNSSKVRKYFNAQKETNELHTNVKSLFGFEQMYEDNAISVDNRYDLSTSSFFINPIVFYEWYVYDILKKYTDESGKHILFDKDKKNSTRRDYLLHSKRKRDITRSSNPDYILVDDEEKVKIVIDAKWKYITQLSDISSSDYLKLKFDSNILKNNEYSISSYFVYPFLYASNDILSIDINDNTYFDFNALEVDMNFEEGKNSLDFSYDYKKIEDDLQKSTKTEKIKMQSSLESCEMDSKRTEIVGKILGQNDLDNKDELFDDLDELFLDSADKLNAEIEEYISEDIQEILEKYSDILEDDSRKFLKSSSSIYNYYKDKNYEHFDYSMPGSGLWKLIELELNTSFSWYLRIKGDVCNSNSPWTNISNKRRSITQDLNNGKKVKLNQCEYGNDSKLQGLMLGGISLLLQDENTIEEFSEILNLNRGFFTEELIDFVKKIILLRNEHAHIKAMSLVVFEELNSLLFEVNNDKSNIEKLLEFKRAVKMKINE